MISDNKKTTQGVQYVLLDKIGNCCSENDQYQVSVSTELVKDVLDECLIKWAC